MERLKNMYVYQVNDDDGQSIFADSIGNARSAILNPLNYLMIKGDSLTSLELMGGGYDVNHWENEGRDVAEDMK
jgi:hypothetical protein